VSARLRKMAVAYLSSKRAGRHQVVDELRLERLLGRVEQEAFESAASLQDPTPYRIRELAKERAK
jgi:hypothetical protein